MVTLDNAELEHLGDLSAFIASSPSPYHAVRSAVERLDAAGFSALDERESFPDHPGARYVERDGALVAWIGGDRRAASGFTIIGAHSDSPNLRLRPRPDHRAVGYGQLGVEVYGGVLLNSWLDRDLGLSGLVTLRAGGSSPSRRLIRLDEPIARIPQLAIHLDRSVNEGLRLDPQRHLLPVWTLGTDGAGGFVDWLASRLDVSIDAIYGLDLMFHDLTPPARIGAHGSMLAAPRLDNLLSCHAGVRALIDVYSDAPAFTGVPVLCLFDHEEVGSASRSGAAGPFLADLLERIAMSEGLNREGWFRALSRSFCVSADGAHATHPSYPERHDPDHLVHLDGGPVLKHNVNERYATDAEGTAMMRRLAAENEIPLQDYTSRNDIPCGSTIGPVTATRLGIRTVDLGVAQLSMHSARELTGVRDPLRLRRLLAATLTRDHDPEP